MLFLNLDANANLLHNDEYFYVLGAKSASKNICIA